MMIIIVVVELANIILLLSLFFKQRWERGRGRLIQKKRMSFASQPRLPPQHNIGHTLSLDDMKKERVIVNGCGVKVVGSTKGQEGLLVEVLLVVWVWQ